MESACQKGSVTAPSREQGLAPLCFLLLSCVAFGVRFNEAQVCFIFPAPCWEQEPFPLMCALIQIPPSFPATLYLTLLRVLPSHNFV